MPWREGEAYDDWDRVAAALFRSLVADGIADAAECQGWPPLVAYGSTVARYDEAGSHLADTEEHAALVALVTGASPFDTCHLARLGPDGTVLGHLRKPLDEVASRMVARWGVPARAEAATLSVRL